MNILTDETYQETIKSGITIIDFWATWCGPCKMYGPIFESVSKEFEDDDNINFYKMDVDSAQATAIELGIISVPATVFIRDGVVVKKVAGLQMANVLSEAVKTLRDL